MSERSYHQFCGLAYALDIIGERWTLLLFRELIAGPRRFKDLVDGLPGISTNLLADRLKTLEQQGMLRRRTLPPPAGSVVYELTPVARGLESTLVELGKWGSQFVPAQRTEDALLRAGSYALTFKTFFRPDKAQGVHESYELHIGPEVLHVRIDDGEIEVTQQETPAPDVVLTATDMEAVFGLLTGALDPAVAQAAGLAQIEGDVDALRRLVCICGLPNPRALEVQDYSV